MKKLLTLLTVTLFLSCAQPQKKESQEMVKKLDYIYKATYLDDFKIGNPNLVLKIQKMHKYLINKDYEMAGNFLAENVVFALGDGSRLEGKEACMKFIIEGYSPIEIEDYQVAVNLAVTGNNGDEWVLLWDNANIVSKDGKSSGFNWVETFQFENEKIIFMNQFSKPRK
jgi:hypothetical protein